MRRKAYKSSPAFDGSSGVVNYETGSYRPWLMLVGGALSCNALAADWAEVGEALADGASSNLYLGVNNKTRTEWYRKDGDNNDWGQDATATETQATVGVDFRSAYLGGLVGFDVAALGRIRLNSDYPTGWHNMMPV